MTVGKCPINQRREIPSHVGFLFQNPDRQILFPTVGEEIAFGFEEKGMTRREALREAYGCLSRFQRAEWFERSIQDLSGGQKQLVCLISVLALEPSLILLDEPFSSLYLHTRLAFAHQLASVRQSIMMASHDLDFLAHFDRILWLEGGVIHADGPSLEVLPAYKANALQHAVSFA
jgi:biotin transport system ATP-binding protein